MGQTWWFEGEHDPGRGDVGALLTVQRELADTAEVAGVARRDLKALAEQVDNSVWTGDAAEEFRRQAQDEALGDLSALEQSYAEAAEGMAAYVAAVEDIAQTAHTLAARIRSAQADYETAVARLRALLPTGAHLTGSLEAPPFGDGAPATVAGGLAHRPAEGGHLTLPLAQADVEEAWAELQVLYRQMHDLQTHDRVAADSAVVAALHHARRTRLTTTRGWSSFWHAVATAALVIGVAVLAVAAVVVVVSLAAGFAVAVTGAGLWAGAAGAAATAASATAIGGTLAIGSTTLATGTFLTLAGAVSAGLSMAAHTALDDSTPTQVTLDTLGIVPGMPGLSRAASAAHTSLGAAGAVTTVRTFTSKDPLVGEVATAIEGAFPGRIHAINVDVPMADGSPREIDILIGDLAIQVKSGAARHLFKQVEETAATTPLRPVAFAPGLPGNAYAALLRAGIPVARTVTELITILREIL